MLFVIDIGNTNIVAGLFNKQQEIIGQWRFISSPYNTQELYEKFISFLSLINIEINQIEAAIISSVKPEITEAIITTFEALFNIKTLVLHRDKLKINVQLNSNSNTELTHIGSDLLANIIAVKKKYIANALIIDFGTATTLCKINNEGIFVGALIVPGINSFNHCLSNTTSLPLVEFKAVKFDIGKNPTEVLQIASFHGYVSMIQGLINKLQQQHDSKLQIIATGGNHIHFIEQNIFDYIEKDLTLIGLKDIYLDNFSFIN